MQLLHRFEDSFDVYFTGRDDGDARDLVSRGVIEKELSVFTDREVRLATVHQVHSGIVHVVGSGGPKRVEIELADGDGMVSSAKDVGLGILVADCAPVALSSPEGIFSAVHAGWQGVLKGVLPEAVRLMRLVGASRISAYVGPSVKSECYEFNGPALREISKLLGPSVVGRTSWDTVSLNLLESIKQSLFMAGVVQIEASDACTACGEYFSYRARKSPERHLMVIVPAGGAG